MVLSKLENHPGSQFSHSSHENLEISVHFPELFSEAKGSNTRAIAALRSWGRQRRAGPEKKLSPPARPLPAASESCGPRGPSLGTEPSEDSCLTPSSTLFQRAAIRPAWGLGG